MTSTVANRILTRLTAALFAVLGIWLMLMPRVIEGFYPLTLDGAMAVSEMRAVFGGMMLGVGAGVLWLDLGWRQPGQAALAMAFVMLGLVLARAVGFFAEGMPSGPVLNETIFEVVVLGLLLATGSFRKGE